MEFPGTALQFAPGTGFCDVVVAPLSYLTQFFKLITSCVDIMMAVDFHAAIALEKE